jgi:hypothetical protein
MENNTDNHPKSALIPIYTFALSYGILHSLVTFWAFKESTAVADAKIWKVAYYCLSIISIVISLAATIASSITYPTTARQNIWGAHFNAGADAITIFSSVGGIWIIITRYGNDKWTLIIMSTLTFVCVPTAILGFISSITSTDGFRGTSFDGISHWGVGLGCWFATTLCFIIGLCVPED